MNSTECSCQGEFQVAEEAEALIQETMTRLRPTSDARRPISTQRTT